MAVLTQRELIIKRLRMGWTSPLDALKFAGTMKLATRVGELKAEGYFILDRWHESKRFKEYMMMRKAK